MVDPAELARQVEAEKIRLVEADLAQTNEFVKGVLGIGAALRGSAITVWLALLGFAAQQNMPVLALLAALVMIVFWVADGYHGWLYGEAFAHAQKIERLLSNYYDKLSRAQDSEHARAKFSAKLRAHRYGLYTGFSSNFNLVQLWRSARPKFFYRWLYPALLVIAIGIGSVGLLGVSLKSGGSSPTRVIIEQAPAMNSSPQRTYTPGTTVTTTPPMPSVAETTAPPVPTVSGSR